MKAAIAEVLSTALYAGYTPKAPGTAGALFGLFLIYVLHTFAAMDKLQLAFLVCLMLGPAVWATNEMIDAMQLEDPQCVVIDEVIGQMIAFLPVSLFNVWDYLAAFLLFRAFDIWKPFPVNVLEKLPRGIGVLADDVMAGVYAALIIYAGQSFTALPL